MKPTFDEIHENYEFRRAGREEQPHAPIVRGAADRQHPYWETAYRDALRCGCRRDLAERHADNLVSILTGAGH